MAPKFTMAARRPAAGRSVETTVQKVLDKRAEKKVSVTGLTPVTIAATGLMNNISANVAQGDNFDQRTGDKITYVSHRIMMRFTALVASQSARFILFSDRFNQGTLPAITDVLQTNTYTAAYNQLLVMQQKRFLIHKDVTIDCSITGESIKTVWVNLGRTGDVFYNGTTAVSASNGKHSLFVLIIGSASTGTYDFVIESLFVDM